MPTAEITKFLTRADLGMRAPRSISRNIAPARGGVTGHFFGPALNIVSHAACVSQWLGAQRYHMDNRDMADIAYTGGFCDHGFAFAGRGAGIRTGANGTTDGNHEFYAVAWIGGAGEEPTPEAINAYYWWVRELRRSGGAGDRSVPHKWHKPTQCAGRLDRHVIVLDNKGIPEEPDMSTRYYEQAVIGHTDTDIKQGSVAATWWDLGLLVVGTDGVMRSVRNPDEVATVGWGFRVGLGARYAHKDLFEIGKYDMVGDDRYGTAREVARALIEHPTIDRRGKPW